MGIRVYKIIKKIQTIELPGTPPDSRSLKLDFVGHQKVILG
jgi:hypothetical protein